MSTELGGESPAPEGGSSEAKAPAKADLIVTETSDGGIDLSAFTDKAAKAPDLEKPADEGDQKTNSERYRFKDAEDQAIANYAKTAGISLIEAAARFRSDDKGSDADTVDPNIAAFDQAEKSATTAISTREEAITSLEEEIQQAVDDEDLGAVAKLNRQLAAEERGLEKARDVLDNAKRSRQGYAQHQQQQVQQQKSDAQAHAYTEQANAAFYKAAEQYPDLNDENSALSKALDAGYKQAAQDAEDGGYTLPPNWTELAVHSVAQSIGAGAPAGSPRPMRPATARPSSGPAASTDAAAAIRAVGDKAGEMSQEQRDEFLRLSENLLK